ncbi:MAG: beta strand repeat-containing protein, partial [Phycisphaerales bacterium]
IAVQAPIITTAGDGTVVLTADVGLLTLTAAGDISAGGAVTLTAAGGIVTGGDVSTTGDAVTFASAVTLSGPVSVVTTAGGSIAGGAVAFASTVTDGASAFDLAIDAGTGGAITAAGAVTIDDLTITDALSATFSGSVQVNDLITAAKPYTLTILGGNNSFAQQVELLNTGKVTMGNATSDIFLFSGGLSMPGNAALDLAATVRSSADAINLGTGALTLVANSVVDTTNNGAVASLVGANVTVGGPVNGTSAGSQSLTVNGGTTGNIAFSSAVGASVRLGALTVTNAANVAFGQAVTATSFTQSAGTGTTTFSGLIGLTGAFNFTGSALTVAGTGSNAIGGTMDVTNSGTFTLASGAALTVAGEFVQDGAGASVLGASITSTNDGIAFSGPVTLSGSVTLTGGGGAGDDIAFGSLVNGTA